MQTRIHNLADRSMQRCMEWSLIFVLWLCVSVHAAPIAPNALDATPDKTQPARSSYDNSNNRPDPFLPVKLKGIGAMSGTVDDRDLHLEGILWHPVKPVAIVNHQSIALNESTLIKLGATQCMAKAILIERDRVVLQFGDRQVELKLER